MPPKTLTIPPKLIHRRTLGTVNLVDDSETLEHIPVADGFCVKKNATSTYNGYSLQRFEALLSVMSKTLAAAREVTHEDEHVVVLAECRGYDGGVEDFTFCAVRQERDDEYQARMAEYAQQERNKFQNMVAREKASLEAKIKQHEIALAKLKAKQEKSDV